MSALCLRLSALGTVLFIMGHVQLVHAHGYLSYPPSRNILWECRQCLNAGGPHYGAGTAFMPGMCGNVPGEPQNWNVPQKQVATYMQGQIFDTAVVLTAQHMGYFALDVCNTVDIDEKCFAQHRIMRAGCTDTSNPDCFRIWKPLTAGESQTYVAQTLGYHGDICSHDVTVFKMRWQLPTDLTCSHCVLRWRYYTTNSCNPENPDNDPTQVSEMFLNCADISIVAHDGNTPQTGPASDVLSAALLNAQPQDLRPFGLAWQCPERALGSALDYTPGTSMLCWAAGLDGVCTIE